jgi:hypothetical protein
MLKIVSIENSEGLTFGKNYEVIYSFLNSYLINNDYNKRKWFNKIKFISLEEHRKNQIRKIFEILDQNS